MIRKGQTVYYYPDGDVKYHNAKPAFVIDHSLCGTVATLKILRYGTDLLKQDVKIAGHPTFDQFPHHLREEGCWQESSPPPLPEVKQNRNRQQRGPSVEQRVAQEVQKLAAAGMSPAAIVGRLKDTGITLDEVQGVLNPA